MGFACRRRRPNFFFAGSPRLRLLKNCKGPVKSNRVLRGGSFNNNRQNVRAARRNRNNPNNRNDNNGFRVVLAHNSLFLKNPRGLCAFGICPPEILRGYGFADEAFT